MANTVKLKKPVEDYVRVWLSSKYNIQFNEGEKQIDLSTGGKHRFDIVSQDGSIIGDIKSSAVRPDGKVGAGTIKSVFLDLYYLSLVKADKKLMVLTNKDFFKVFENRAKGKILPDTELVYCELPASLSKEVLEINRMARGEISKRIFA